MNYLYELALSQIPSVGPVIAKRLISVLGHAEPVFCEPLSRLKKIPNIPAKLLHTIHKHKKEALLKSEQELKFIQANHVEVLYYQSEHYPDRLKPIEDAPLLLFKQGFGHVNYPKVLGIVGTRKNTHYGKTICENIIKDLAVHKDILMVSGLAYGIDIIAHEACLEHNIPTFGVLGNGFQNIYPARHQATANQMMKQGGILSEFLSDCIPDRENFPKRNRIVAGMVDALLVIESDIKGGSMITANMANSYQKDVMAIPGMAGEMYSSGCNYLIKNNIAALVENASDLEKLMNWDLGKRNIKSQIPLFHDFNAQETMVVDLLKHYRTMGIDELLYKTNLKMSELLSTLLSLEFKFVVLSQPGKRYTIMQ